MILKFQYLISGLTFITSSISVIIATNKPASYESQLISEVSYIEKLSETYEKNTDKILEAAEKRRNNLARIVQELQNKKSNNTSLDGTSIWENSNHSKKSFSQLVGEFGWREIKNAEKLDKLSKYKKEKVNLFSQCQEWNNKSYNMLFINYLVWCTNKSPFLKQ